MIKLINIYDLYIIYKGRRKRLKPHFCIQNNGQFEGFFRRADSQGAVLECPRNKNCPMDRANRNRCRYCRMKKCLEFGMNRKPGKVGGSAKRTRVKVREWVAALH